MSDVRSFEIIQQELNLARERVKELEHEIHEISVGAYFAFIVNNSDRRGVIAVADDRIDFLTKELGFACRILDGNVLVGEENWTARNICHSGWRVPIDGETLEVSDFDSDTREPRFLQKKKRMNGLKG
jgi:hypothetical protein